MQNHPLSMRKYIYLGLFLCFSIPISAQMPLLGGQLATYSDSERDKLTNVKEGFTIYNTTTKCINYYTIKGWRALCGQCMTPPSMPKIASVDTFYNSITLTLVPDGFSHKTLLLPNFTIVGDTGLKTIVIKKEGQKVEGFAVISIDECGSSEPLAVEGITFSKKDPCGNVKVIKDERNGVSYKVNAIGNQCWMTENLQYGKPDGKRIIQNPETMSYLYSWDFGTRKKNPQTGGNIVIPTANTLCPAGWHVPTLQEGEALVQFYQKNGNTELMQKGFNFTQTEVYNPEDKVFEKQGDRIIIWTSGVSPNDDNRAAVFITEREVMMQYIPAAAGLPIRCIKD